MLVNCAACTGCGACTAVCPRNCIEMISDAEGFRLPAVDTQNCIGCDLCERVCPVLKKPALHDKPEALAVKNRHPDIRASSSSGGVFTALAEAVIAEGGAVCAAKYDADFSVVHEFARTSAELTLFRGAKYAQSRAEHCYPKIRELLQQGTKVLFAGTPCQVTGLASYLGKPYPNLILVDIICHGVPSPKVWQRYLKERKKLDAPASPLESINLRSKESGWSRYAYSVEMNYEDGGRYCVPQGQDWYMRGFTENLYLRRSCEACHFKGLQRCSDLTLGDFWGIWELYPEFDDNRGTSLLWVHSDKGIALWNSVKGQFDTLPVPVEESVKFNASAITSSVPHPKRGEFFTTMGSGEIIPLIKKLLEPEPQTPSVFRRILNRLKR